jgi:hypothetical protein
LVYILLVGKISIISIEPRAQLRLQPAVK